MGVVIPVGFMQVIHPFQHSGVPEQWTCTYGMDVAVAANVQTILNSAHTAWTSEWSNNVDSQVTMLQAVGYYRPAPNVLQLLTAQGASVVGTLVQSSASPQVSVVIRKRTAFVGRNQRGRLYLPSAFVGENIVDEAGLLLPAAVTAFQTGADSLLTALAAIPDTDGMALLHNDPLIAPSQVIKLLVQPVIRTQRRRIAG